MISLTRTHCEITKEDFDEQFGIMQQLTYEHSGDNEYANALMISEMPWKYIETITLNP